MIKSRQISAFGISLVVHLAVLAALGTVRYAAQNMIPEMVIDTVFSEERTQEEFNRQLEVATEVAQTVNLIAGSAQVSESLGGTGAPAVAQKQIETSESLKSDFTVNPGTVEVTGLAALGTDLGEGEVTGNIGAVVEGYGAALKQLTQELLRHMRENRVMVVWLFDESESMTDDRKEIAQQFHTVYEELGIVQKQDQQLKNAKDVLQTVICGFGDKITLITPKPTANIPEIQLSIGKVKLDESGKENVCAALSATLDEYGPMTRKAKQKLVVVIVTDESGDDGANIDQAIERAKKYNAPVYVLGREAVFGTQYARIRWVDPKYNLTHWLLINRGPETPFAECLQTDGLHERWDSYSSGFGPYELVRMSKESGGVYYVLPGEEENLSGQEAVEKRKFQFYDMKEYVPNLDTRREYEQERNQSKFRKTLWDVIQTLDPYKDKELHIQEHWYPIAEAEFGKTGAISFQRAIRAMVLFDQAAETLLKIRPLRDKEASQRWRANYDLMLAQTMAYRVRLFQFCLAMDQHKKHFPKPKSEKSNVWNLARTAKMIEPDAQVVKVTKVDTAKLNQQEQAAREMFELVKRQHPRTPWSNRAEYELQVGFGFQFAEGFRDPRYDNVDFKLPKP